MARITAASETCCSTRCAVYTSRGEAAVPRLGLPLPQVYSRFNGRKEPPLKYARGDIGTKTKKVITQGHCTPSKMNNQRIVQSRQTGAKKDKLNDSTGKPTAMVFWVVKGILGHERYFACSVHAPRYHNQLDHVPVCPWPSSRNSSVSLSLMDENIILFYDNAHPIRVHPHLISWTFEVAIIRPSAILTGFSTQWLLVVSKTKGTSGWSEVYNRHASAVWRIQVFQATADHIFRCRHRTVCCAVLKMFRLLPWLCWKVMYLKIKMLCKFGVILAGKR